LGTHGVGVRKAVDCRKATQQCPCGFLGHPRRACRCAPSLIARYRGRISGPLLERIDLVVEVPVETKQAERLWQRTLPLGEPAGAARERVEAARHWARASRAAACVNARLEGAELSAGARLTSPAERLLKDAAERWSLSARAVHRTLRVARTVADLAAAAAIGADAVAEALSLRHETPRP
jgi:magnesium chelatase family protein